MMSFLDHITHVLCVTHKMTLILKIIFNIIVCYKTHICPLLAISRNSEQKVCTHHELWCPDGASRAVLMKVTLVLTMATLS